MMFLSDRTAEMTQIVFASECMEAICDVDDCSLASQFLTCGMMRKVTSHHSEGLTLNHVRTILTFMPLPSVPHASRAYP